MSESSKARGLSIPGNKDSKAHPKTCDEDCQTSEDATKESITDVDRHLDEQEQKLERIMQCLTGIQQDKAPKRYENAAKRNNGRTESTKTPKPSIQEHKHTEGSGPIKTGPDDQNLEESNWT